MMDLVKGKKEVIIKTWKRCTSFGKNSSGQQRRRRRLGRKRRSVAPEGCLSVYVGADRERFVVKTEYVNHPLFKILLEEAELEYGYRSEGPLALPCDVDFFLKVLVEMEAGAGTGSSRTHDYIIIQHGCGFPKTSWTSSTSHRPLL